MFNALIGLSIIGLVVANPAAALAAAIIMVAPKVVNEAAKAADCGGKE